MLAHRAVLYPRPGYELRCVDCHRNLVHNARTVYDYKVCNYNGAIFLTRYSRLYFSKEGRGDETNAVFWMVAAGWWAVYWQGW